LLFFVDVKKSRKEQEAFSEEESIRRKEVGNKANV